MFFNREFGPGTTITKSISLCLLTFHFLSVDLMYPLACAQKDMRTRRCSLIHNSDYLGPARDCFLTVFLGTGEWPIDISSQELLHGGNDTAPKS